MPRPRSLRSITIAPNTRRYASPAPPSPTFSDTSHASAMNFGANGPEKIITRANLKASLHAYEELMNTSANYRAALLAMSKATAAFADAMEKCSGLKGPSYEAGTRLQAASGLHHLIGNHWHVLAETLDQNFEKPLRQHLEKYRAVVTERSVSYETALHEKSQIIRQTESHSMNKKERNLQTFREALFVLQRQVDELDALKAQHYQEILEHEEEVWDAVQGKVCVVVRSTMDVFDRFTSKASDPILEPMIQSIPDPFDSYGPPREEDQIFSILPPLSIMTKAPSPSPSPLASTPENEPVPEIPPASTWGHTNGTFFAGSNSQWADVPTSSSTPPQSVSPPTPPLSSSSSSSSPASHRHVPAPAGQHQRKPESKLSSSLSVIEENHSREPSDEATPPSQPIPLPPTLNGNTPEPNSSLEELPLGGKEAIDDTGTDTPRHLNSPIPQSIQPPDAEPDHLELELQEEPQQPPMILPFY